MTMEKKGKVVWVREEIYNMAKELVNKGFADSISEVFTNALLEYTSNKKIKINIEPEKKETLKEKLREVAKFLEEISKEL